MDEDKKDLMQDENYVLENITQEIEMIKDDTIPVPENTLKEEELIVETPKVEESVEAPIVTSDNIAPVSTQEPTVAPVEPAPVVDTVNTEANTIVSENVNKEDAKKKSKLPIILILIILLAGVGAGVYFLTKGNNTSTKPEEKKEEKKEEEKEKEEEYDVEKAGYMLDNFIFDHFHILDDDVKCAGLLSVFFKGKEITSKDLSDEVVGSYIAGYASKAKSVDCVSSESTDCIGGNDKFTMTLDEYKLFGSHLFGESRSYNIIPKLNYRSTECLYDEDTKTYNCTNNISYTGCTYYFEEHKLVKASKQGDIFRLYFKVVFEKDNKFYSDFEKTKEIEAVSATEAIEKIDESNYMITLKKVSSHYEFINSNIVK